MTSAFVVRKGKPAMFSYKQFHFTLQPCQNFLWYKLSILLQAANQNDSFLAKLAFYRVKCLNLAISETILTIPILDGRIVCVDTSISQELIWVFEA